LSDNIHNARRRWEQWLHQGEEIRLDLVAFAIQELTSAVLLEAFKGRDMSAEDELVDSLYKVVMELFALLFFLGPVVGVCLGIDAMNLLVVFNQRVDGVGGELVGDLVAQDHVNVDNVSLNMNELIAEESLGRIRRHICLGELREHQGGESPDSVGRRQSLGQAALVLRDAVEWALHTVDALEGLC
jgi:hypothetical protein